MKKEEQKTNAIRSLEQKKIDFKVYNYSQEEAISGVEVASVLGQNPDMVFKTLVTVGKSGNHYVFMIPVAKELDLKKAAKAVGEKNIEMIKSKDLLPLTGYIHDDRRNGEKLRYDYVQRRRNRLPGRNKLIRACESNPFFHRRPHEIIRFSIK